MLNCRIPFKKIREKPDKCPKLTTTIKIIYGKTISIMNNKIKVILLTAILSISFIISYGQTTSDKIIFLTDHYTDFINKVKANDKNTDSLYKACIQNTICDKYFKKSEYADIVRDLYATPIRNTTELSKSIDRLAQNQEKIKNKIIGTLKKSREYIKNDSLTIYIIPANYDGRMVIEAMSGIMGLTAGSKQIILTIEPEVQGWENMLEYAIAHEYNHAYWTNMNYLKTVKWTLLDYLVFEGKGDYFAHMLYPDVIAPWTISLSDNQRLDLWQKIRSNLQNEDIGYQMEVMFGSQNYPVWGGYSIGYDIVLTALTNNDKLRPEDWINLDSGKILEKSKYK